jgi:hypothetical protein
MLGVLLAGAVALAGCGGNAGREVSVPAQPPAAQAPAAQAPADPCDPSSPLQVTLRRRVEKAIKKTKAHPGYVGAVNSGCATLPVPPP